MEETEFSDGDFDALMDEKTLQDIDNVVNAAYEGLFY